MLTKHDILAAVDERAGNTPRRAYTEREERRLEGEELLVRVPEGTTIDDVVRNHLKLTRDNHNRRLAAVVALPSEHRIPSGDSNRQVKDVTEQCYHELHLPRFVKPTLERLFAEQRVAPEHEGWLREWALTQKTLTREVVRAAYLHPQDLVPSALLNADPALQHGWNNPRPRLRAKEARPKLGVAYMNLAHKKQFILLPYINALDGLRMLAREYMKELPAELKSEVHVNLVQDGDRFHLSGRVQPFPGSPARGSVDSYGTFISYVPFGPELRVGERSAETAARLADQAWLLSANCECPDFGYRAAKNTYQALPAIKGCKHIIMTLLKATRVMPTLDVGGVRRGWHSAPVPIGLGTRGYALHRVYELETRVLIDHGGSLQPLNKTEVSAWLGETERAAVAETGDPFALFEYGRLRFSGRPNRDFQKVLRIERENIAKGPPGYLA